MAKPKHGGPRLGAGRPQKTPEEKAATAAARLARQAEAAAAKAGLAAAKPAKRKRAKRAKVKPEASAAKVPAQAKPPAFDISRLLEEALRVQRRKERRPENSPFFLDVKNLHPPAATPPKGLAMDAKLRGAMDDSLNWAAGQWAGGGAFGTAVSEGQAFLGFPYLSELAQRPEYRVMSETIADDATRKWIDFEITGTTQEIEERQEEDAEDPAGAKERREGRVKTSQKMDKVKALKDEMERIQLRDRMYQVSRDDGFFGRSHCYLDFGVDLDGASGSNDELTTPIGDGRDDVSKAKIAKGSLRGLRVIEPVWTYPMTYNAINPLRQDWYNPQVWYVLGKQIHVSRIPVFIAHPVPDLLKPTYSFGGLSLSQMAQPYVDIWLQTRQAVAQLIHSFSVMVLSTDMQQRLQSAGGMGDVIGRAQAFNMFRDNAGLFILNKDTEEFSNVSAPLSGLEALQAQAQEHMCSVVRIPVMKFTGISPTGMNACLTGDTLIETDQGLVPIKEVHAGQKVMTREGWASVAKAGCTGYATNLIEIEAGESTVRCTADHRIWLPSINAFVRAENVRHGDLLLYRGEIENRNTVNQSLIAAGSGGTEEMAITPPLSTMTENICFTGKFGAFITDPFQKAATFITSTETARTISLIISKCLRPQITRGFTAWLKGSLFINQSNMSANAAIAAIGSSYRSQRELNFAVTGVGSPIDGVTEPRGPSRIRSAFASCVESLSRRSESTQNTALENAQPRARTALHTCPATTKKTARDGSSTANAIVSSVRRVPAHEFVYDIQVARGHLPEFFANGICVHNSSEGEIRAYYDTIAAYQNRFLRPNLTRILNFMQLSLWGEVDPEITFVFEPLWEMSEKERAELQKTEAERDQLFVDGGAIGNDEWRERIIDDPHLPFADLDPEDVPDLRSEEESGLVPEGGGRAAEPLLESGPQTGAGAAEENGPKDAAFADDEVSTVIPTVALARKVARRRAAAADADPIFDGAFDADWDEGKHPRGQPNNAGQFGPGGGGGGEPKPKGYGWHKGQGEAPPHQTFHMPQYGLQSPPQHAHGGAYGEWGGEEWGGHWTPPPPPKPLDPTKLERVGGQMGSNPGGVFKDESGRKFYVKKGQSKDHVRNELTAAALYRLAGAPTLRYRDVEGGGHIATEMEKLDKDNATKFSADEIRKARRDFAADAWLANYDSVGTGGDNLAMIAGRPTRVDLGGALEYRARGKPKGKTFGDEATEVDTMRDPKIAPDAAKVFADITPAEFRASARRVAEITDDEIKAAVEKFGGPPALADKLIARRDDIAERADTFGGGGDPEEKDSVVVFPAGAKPPIGELNGVAFDKWTPPADGDWNDVDGQTEIEGEEALPERVKGKQLASGVVIKEKDGRAWLMRPKNAFGGYEATWPKGRVEPGLSMQANAIKEAFEETGLKVKIVGHLGDREGDVTFTRYYTAERETGNPADAGGETDGVVLAPKDKLAGFLNRARDLEIAGVSDIAGDKGWSESEHERDGSGRFGSGGSERAAFGVAWARKHNKHNKHHHRQGVTAAGAALGYGDAAFDWEEGKHPRGQPENKGQFGPGGGGSSKPKPTAGSKAVAPGQRAAVPAKSGGKTDHAKVFGKAMADQLKKANEALEAAPKKDREEYAAHVDRARSFFSSDKSRASTASAIADWAKKHAAGIAQHHIETAMMMPVIHHVVEAAVEQVGLGTIPGVTMGATAVAAYAAHNLIHEYNLTLGGAKELLVGVVRGAIDVLGGTKEVAARIAELDAGGYVGGDEKSDSVLDALILLLLAVEDLDDEDDAEGEGGAEDEAPFEEGKHPRDAGGKFASKGNEGAGGGGGSEPGFPVDKAIAKAVKFIHGGGEPLTAAEEEALAEHYGSAAEGYEDLQHLSKEQIESVTGGAMGNALSKIEGEFGKKHGPTDFNNVLQKAMAKITTEGNNDLASAEAKVKLGVENDVTPDDLDSYLSTAELFSLGEKYGTLKGAMKEIETQQATAIEKEGNKAKKTKFGGLWKETGKGDASDVQFNAGIVAGKPAFGGQSYRQMIAYLIKEGPGAGLDDAAMGQLKAKMTEALFKAQAKAADLGKTADVNKITDALGKISKSDPSAYAAGAAAYGNADIAKAANVAIKAAPAGEGTKTVSAKEITDKLNANLAAKSNQALGEMTPLQMAQEKYKAAMELDASYNSATWVTTAEQDEALKKAYGSTEEAWKTLAQLKKAFGEAKAAAAGYAAMKEKFVSETSAINGIGGSVTDMAEAKLAAATTHGVAVNALLEQLSPAENKALKNKYGTIAEALSYNDEAKKKAEAPKPPSYKSMADVEKHQPAFAEKIKAIAAQYKVASKTSSRLKVKAAVENGAPMEALLVALKPAEKAKLTKMYGTLDAVWTKYQEWYGPNSPNGKAKAAAAQSQMPTAVNASQPTEQELAKAKKTVALQIQYVPNAPADSPEAQKLVAEFNKKWADKPVPDDAVAKAKIADFKAMQQKMVPLMNAAQKEAAEKAQYQKEHAAEIAAQAAAKLKADAAKHEAEIAEYKRALGIGDAEAQGFEGLVSLLGKDKQSLINEFKNNDSQAGHGVSKFEGSLIASYKSNSSIVNEEMRKPMASWKEPQVMFAKVLNKALSKLPGWKGETVRNAGLTTEIQQRYTPGHVVFEHGFTGTSKSGPEGVFSGNTRFYVTGIGKRGADISKMHGFQGEGEVLYQAHTMFRVDKVAGQPGGSGNASYKVWMTEIEM